MLKTELKTKQSGIKSLNPFASWAAKRKQERAALASAAAKQITDDIAKNEMAIISTLESIDFLHSRLPQEILEEKKDPNQTCCNLERQSRMLQKKMRNPQIITMDIRSFDEKLLILAKLFKQSVEQGDVNAAKTARAALMAGICKIRMRIPENQPDIAKLFVETNTKYLESWITLVNLQQGVDRMEENARSQKEAYDEAIEKDEAAINEMEKRLQSDADYQRTVDHMLQYDSDRSKWTEEDRKLHVQMIDDRMRQVNLELNKMLLTEDEQELASQKGQVGILYGKVRRIPIVLDPDLMNKYQEQMEELFHAMAESDANVERALILMDDIEGRLKQLENAPGAQRAREVAAEQARANIDRIKERQQARIRNRNDGDAKLREKLDIYTEEEIKELQKLVEAEEIHDMDLVIENEIETEDQAEYLTIQS